MTSYRDAAKATAPQGTKGKRATCTACRLPIRRESKAHPLWQHTATGSFICQGAK